jgi:hypothetical protein
VWVIVSPRAAEGGRSAPFLKQARLFCDRAISTLIFDEREMESLARPSVIVRVAAAFWTAGARLFNSRRLCVPFFGSKARLGQEHKDDFQKECSTNLKKTPCPRETLRCPLFS